MQKTHLIDWALPPPANMWSGQVSGPDSQSLWLRLWHLWCEREWVPAIAENLAEYVGTDDHVEIVLGRRNCFRIGSLLCRRSCQQWRLNKRYWGATNTHSGSYCTVRYCNDTVWTLEAAGSNASTRLITWEVVCLRGLWEIQKGELESALSVNEVLLAIMQHATPIAF